MELDGIEANQRAVNMEKIIAIDDEMHSHYRLGIAECGIDIKKIRNPKSEIYLSKIIQPLFKLWVFPFDDIKKGGLKFFGDWPWFPTPDDSVIDFSDGC